MCVDNTNFDNMILKYTSNISTVKDRSGIDLTEAKDIKKRCQEYTKELYKKDLHEPENQDGPRSWQLSNTIMLLLLLPPPPPLLSRFHRVRICATPQTVARRAPPSLGFSRQEHCGGFPFPSPRREREKGKASRSVLSYSERPHGPQPTRLPRPWDSPGKNTGVGCHCLLRYTEHSIQKQQNTHSSAHGTFSTIDHILGQKLSLNKFLKLKIISSIFCDHNTIRLEINYKKKKKTEKK